MTTAIASRPPIVGETTETSPAPAVLRPPSRRWYPPSLLALGLTGWLAGHGALVLARSGDLARTISSARHQLIGPVLLGFLLVVLLAERLWPAVRRPLLARGHLQDAVYLLLYALAVVPLVVLIGVGFSDTLRHTAPWLVLPSLRSLPPWVAIAVGIVAMDGCNWLAHWANHRFRALGRLHALHHSQEEMWILTTFRTHPLVHTSFLLTVVPTVALLANAAIPSAAVLIYLVLATFPHANLNWTLGPLGRIVVSPAYHRIHHAAAGPNDVNLGTVLTLWDVLAHRAVFPVPGAAVIATGIAGRPLPLEQAGDRSRPLRALGLQLAEPFVSQPSASHHLAFTGRKGDMT